MGNLRTDLRLALRRWRRDGITSLISLFSLACGVATVVAVFAVLDGVWLKPLPYAAPSRLVAVWEANPAAGIDRQPTSTPNFLDWRARAHSLEDFAATSSAVGRSLDTGGSPVEIGISGVTEGFFRLLGVTPVVGRSFAGDEFGAGGPPVALITYRLWQNVFAGRSDIVGLEVSLDKRPLTILGVLPEGYVHPDWRDFEQRRTDLFIPMPLHVSESDRRRDWLAVIGRLADTAGLPAAADEMTSLSGELAREHPQANDGYQAVCTPLKQALFGHWRGPLGLALAAASAVLLLVLNNLITLGLGQMIARSGDTAVHVALGADRRHLLRRSLTENLLLGFIAWCLSLGIAAFLLRWIERFSPFVALDIERVDLGAPEILVAATLCGFISLGLTLFFAFQGGVRFPETLRSGSSRVQGSRTGRMRLVVVVAQYAIAQLVLIGMALLLRSYLEVQSQETGFRADRVVTAEVRLPRRTSSEDQRTALFLQSLQDAVRALPGVEHVGAVSTLPLGGEAFSADLGFRIADRPDSEQPHRVLTTVITPGFFEATEISLLAGRMLQEWEFEKLVLVNQTLVDRFFPSSDPLGQWIHLGVDPPTTRRMIVGIVADIQQEDRTSSPDPQVFLLHTQRALSSMTLVLRTQTTDPMAVVPSVRAALKDLDPGGDLLDLRTGQQLLTASVARNRITFQLGALCAGLSLLFAIVGIYGVVSFAVRQRSQELSLRMALGAERRSVVALLLGQGLRVMVAGMGVGTVAALLLSSLLGKLLVGVAPSDPKTIFAVTLLFVTVSVLAMLVPARHALRLDPARLLSGER